MRASRLLQVARVARSAAIVREGEFMASQAKSPATAGIYKRLKGFGDAFTPEVIGENLKLFAPLHEKEPFADVEVIRDLRYGDDERHRLNVFQAKGAAKAARPVLVFVHGGGFIGGDKSMPGMPFYDNVGKRLLFVQWRKELQIFADDFRRKRVSELPQSFVDPGHSRRFRLRCHEPSSAHNDPILPRAGTLQ